MKGRRVKIQYATQAGKPGVDVGKIRFESPVSAKVIETIMHNGSEVMFAKIENVTYYFYAIDIVEFEKTKSTPRTYKSATQRTLK